MQNKYSGLLVLRTVLGIVLALCHLAYAMVFKTAATLAFKAQQEAVSVEVAQAGFDVYDIIGWILIGLSIAYLIGGVVVYASMIFQKVHRLSQYISAACCVSCGMLSVFIVMGSDFSGLSFFGFVVYGVFTAIPTIILALNMLYEQLYNNAEQNIIPS